MDFGEFHENNKDRWSSVYFVGIIKEDCPLTKELTGECSVLEWCSFEKAQQLIPNCIQERLDILKQVHSKQNWIKRAIAK